MFLVFGRADLETHRLEARRVQLGAVSLGTTLRARGIALDLGARQFVFARVFRDAKAGQAAAPASAEPTGATRLAAAGACPGRDRGRAIAEPVLLAGPNLIRKESPAHA